MFWLFIPCSSGLRRERAKSHPQPLTLETHTPWCPGLCARGYLKPRAKLTHLPGPSRWGVVDFFTLR